MASLNRRAVLGCFCGAGAAAFLPSPPSTAIRIREVTHDYEEYRYRTPYKFGGREVDRVTLLNVHCTVETLGGAVAKGFGSMPLGNVWSFPSATMSYDTTLNAMKVLASRIARLTADYHAAGHPIDINVALEPEFLRAADQVSRELALREPIPKLCTLVTASPFDAAVHDAFGKAHHLNCYLTYGREFLPRDLSYYLGAEYRGEYLDQYIATRPKPRLAVYHSIGAADPITTDEVKRPIHDGLPVTLPEWIRYNGLTHFKIKLNGDDIDWDVNRVLHIHAVAAEVLRQGAVGSWQYSLDFNERCPNVEYLLDFLRRVGESTPECFERIQYIEQPTARDLRANRANVMHAAARLRPVVIDESLTGIDALLLARDMGYTGAALKACKGQSQVLLMTAVGRKKKMFLCVQDLTCPGASLIHSAGLAAHVPEVTTIEANAREYVPAANDPWAKRFPGIFVIKDGTMSTSELTGPGLGAVP